METFNLANIYSAAENVKGMRSRNELLNQKQNEDAVVQRVAQSARDPQTGEVDVHRLTNELASQGYVERAQQIRDGYVDHLTKAAQYVNAMLPRLNPATYPAMKQQLESSGMVQKGFFPEQYDPAWMQQQLQFLGAKIKESEQWSPLSQIPGAPEGTLGQTNTKTNEVRVAVKPGSDNGEPLVKVMTEAGERYVPRSQAAGMQPAQSERLVQVERPDGSVVYVPSSQASGAKPATGRPKVTGDNQNAAGFYDRMSRAEGLLGGYVPSTADFLAFGKVLEGGGLMSSAANQVLSPEAQKYYQAASDWVRAKLRKESGAAIGQGEMLQEIRTYFPVPGDDPSVIEQKRGAREVATKSMHRAAGPALEQKPATPGQQPLAAPNAQGGERKTVNGKTFVKVDGQWFEEG